MATNSSRKSKTTLLGARETRSLLESSGLHPSLPHCILDAKGNLIACNGRMSELLSFKSSPRAVLAQEEVSARWPFFNEEHSSLSLFQKVSRGPTSFFAEPIIAEAGLRTFKLRVIVAAPKAARAGARRLVTAELLRRGDLLQDKNSRQALFRSLSHEIRTSVTALKGYLSMLEGGGGEKEIRERMDFSLKRLESVVKRLEEFKAELGVDV